MKHSHQVLFIAAFLAAIYVVPLSQTAYEYLHNSGHRIQMLDLVEDVFVTPIRRANADAAMLDSLALGLDSLAGVVRQAQAADSAAAWDASAGVGLVDEAAIRVKLLANSVIDYNRHIQGERNHFAARDTLQPYYRALQATRRGLDTLLLQVQAADPAAAAGALEQVQALAAQARELFGGRKGVADYPRLTLVALRRIMVGANYLRPYEKAMEKSSIFANGVRPWMLLAHYAFFEDLGDKGVLGRKGWFFYRPDVDYLAKPYVRDVRSRVVDPNDAPVCDSIVDSVVAFRRQLAGRGVDLLVVIMPGKPSIYPDLLAPGMQPGPATTFGHSMRMMKELNAAGVETVDLFSAFAAERASDSAAGDSLYLHTDTHFRSRAVALTARVVAERIRQYDWFQPGTVEYAIDTVRVPRHGDVGEMTKLPAMDMRGLRFSFPAETTTCYQVWRVERDESGAQSDRTLYRDDYQRSAVLVLGDSFSRIYQTDEPRAAGWIAHLGAQLGQPVASVVNDGGASTLVRQTLGRKPGLLRNKKLVVWEIVERDFRFGAEGWKNVAIGEKNAE